MNFWVIIRLFWSFGWFWAILIIKLVFFFPLDIWIIISWNNAFLYLPLHYLCSFTSYWILFSFMTSVNISNWAYWINNYCSVPRVSHRNSKYLSIFLYLLKIFDLFDHLGHFLNNYDLFYGHFDLFFFDDLIIFIISDFFFSSFYQVDNFD